MSAAPKDLIMWVGAKPYKTWESFAEEARLRNVCKRVLHTPRGITLGQSRCYLIHGQRVVTKVPVRVHSFQKVNKLCRYCGISPSGYAQNGDQCKERFVRRAGKPIAFIYGYFLIESAFQANAKDAGTVPERLCGNMKEGAWYLSGPLTEFVEPKRYTGPSYVGFRYTERVTVGD